MRLDGKVALITGGAHGVKGEMMGFGGAAAWLFVAEGAKVVLGDIDVEAGEKTASEIRGEGGQAVFVRLDVTSQVDWEGAVRTAIDSFGKLDVLVNNAGTGALGGVEETTEEEWDGQMDVHAKGAYLGTRAVVPEMRRPAEARSSTYRRYTASWAARERRLTMLRKERCASSPNRRRYSTPRKGSG